MHRTQLKKKKKRKTNQRLTSFFLSALFSLNQSSRAASVQLDVWEDTWVQSKLCQIIQ
jgi:hypothetical protein